MNCPLCAAKDAALLTERKQVPILQNLLCPTEKNALQIPRGQIALYMCKNCQFVYNSAYEQLTYDTSYENNQSHSHYFAHYLESEIKHIAEKINASPKTTLLLEAGCGQGDFLKKVVENLDEQRNWQAIGFDPAYHGKQTNEKDRCRFIRDYFRANSITKPYERILCLARHVIEHIPDPKFLLAECNRLPAKEIQLFLETPDFNWILHQGAFEDIVYEHCSFFNPTSIKILLHTFGFEIQTLQNTFGVQYLCI